MTCGDTTAAWVPFLGASTWTGDISPIGKTFTVVFTSALAAAVTEIDELLYLGTWELDGTALSWTAVLSGSSWTFTVMEAAQCDGSGNVTGASGMVIDGDQNEYEADMTRSL